MILSRLVEDLLDLSRFQQQRVHLNIAPVDMVQVINAAIDMNRPAADAKGVRIATDVTPAPALILGDTMRLQQVVSNLISNAIKFTPAEGVVTLRLSSAATQLEIVVTDTGEGIAPEFLPHVFEPFGKGSRESGTKASASVSTGCDLSLHGVSTGAAASLRPTPPGTWKFLPPSDLIGTAYREPFRHVLKWREVCDVQCLRSR